MLEELAEVLRFLTSEGFVVSTPQGYSVFTNKFYEQYRGLDIGIVTSPAGEIVLAKSKTAVIGIPIVSGKKLSKEETREAYLNFIIACKVPRKVANRDGSSYDANQYSEPGRKAFADILARVQSGELQMELVTKSTQLYYARPGGYKLKIGNYIGEGTWESDYRALVESMEKGSASLTKHIKTELKDESAGTSRYNRG